MKNVCSTQNKEWENISLRDWDKSRAELRFHHNNSWTSEISTSTFFCTHRNKTYNLSLNSPNITLNRTWCSPVAQYENINNFKCLQWIKKSCCKITSFWKTNLRNTLLREVSCSCSGSPEEGVFKLGIFSIAKQKQKPNPNQKKPKQNKTPSHMWQVMLCYDDRSKEKK